MEKPAAHELASISRFFISGPEEKGGASSSVPDTKGTGRANDEGEIEETVAVRKRIAYPNDRGGQENIKRNLFKFLQEGYSLSRIELRRISETNKPGNRIVTTEEIALYLK